MGREPAVSEPVSGTPDPAAVPDVIDSLTGVLVRMCRALADAGDPVQAGRLSAQGWVVLRHEYPNQAARINGAMHYAARQETREGM